MEEQCQMPKWGFGHKRPVLALAAPVVQRLVIDVPKGLSQRQWRQVKKQRLAHEFGQNRRYHGVVVNQLELPDGKSRYELVAWNMAELMAAWQAGYQQTGPWPRVSVGQVAVDRRLSWMCWLHYGLSKIRGFAWAGVMAVPLVLLSGWSQQLHHQFQRLVIKWRQSSYRESLPVMTKPVRSPLRDVLYPQLQLLGQVFGSHVRVTSMDWSHSAFMLQGEADSVFHFSQAWDQWQRADPHIDHQLQSYGYKKRPFFKVKIALPQGDQSHS